MGSIHSHPRFVSWAAQDGRVEDLVYHLQKAGKNSLKPSALSPKQRAPIHLAAIGGHSECVKVLFDAGRGAPGFWELVRFRFSPGSPLEVTDKEGHTALHLAVSNQHYRTVQVLLSLGAKPNSKTRCVAIIITTFVFVDVYVVFDLAFGVFLNLLPSICFLAYYITWYTYM